MLKKITDKLYLMKILNVCSGKRMKKQTTYGEKILQNIYFVKDLYSKCTKNSQNSTIRRQKHRPDILTATLPEKIYE